MSSSEEECSKAEGASSDTRDRHLARRIRDGGKAAFEGLFRRYFDELCAFAESYVRSPETAEDLVHDVFCDVWDRRTRFCPDGTVKAYLFRAVRNKAYNQLKRRRVRREWKAEKEQDVGSTPSLLRNAHASRSAEYADLKEAMHHAVEDLSERQRTVFQMAHYHGLSYAEIATVLGISPKTVENHMGRALKQLRERLVPFLALLFALF